MWSDYYFYLISLPETERNNQIIIMICFWTFMFLVGIIDEFIKKNNYNKNNWFVVFFIILWYKIIKSKINKSKGWYIWIIK